jgi:putative hydrolase
MEMEADLHTHSIASGHALNTIFELASAARQRRLKLIGVTEHGPNMEGAPHAGYFEIAQYTPLKINGVTVLIGCEANIIDTDGRIDLEEEYLKLQKIVLVGLHTRTNYKGKNREDHTRAIINSLRSTSYIHIISHPFRLEFPTNVEEIVKVACETGVALEINCLVFRACNYNRELIKQYEKIIKLAYEYNVSLAVSSDAHIATHVGDFSALKYVDAKCLKNAKELVINRSAQSALNFLSRRCK